MSEGILSMAKLDGLLYGQTSQLGKLVQDGRRFIQYYKHAIENSPLQVYASALIFSPARSIIKNQFQSEESKWIITNPIMEDDWSACIQTLEGHSDGVNSVAFSPDSQLVASASHDKTVRLWSAATGECQQTLEGHSSWVSSVAFSHDSQLVASASDDNTVRLWSAATGNCIQIFNIGIASSNLSFDYGGLQLYTEVGALSLENITTRPSTISAYGMSADNGRDLRSGYGISPDHCWITFCGKNLVWLPADRRPTCSAVSGSTLVIGYSLGRVLILGFSTKAFLGRGL